MRKISLFAVAAAVVATGLGVWAASGDGIEAFHLMMNAKDLPTAEFEDYTFVFS